MAQKPKVIHCTLLLTDTDHHRYETLPLPLVQHPSETVERLLARLIAFGLEYEEGLAFGGGISSQGEAPIWLRNDHEQVEHWIEIGQPDPKHLEHLHRRMPRLSLYCYGPQSGRWWQQQGPQFKGMDKLRAWQLDWAGLSELAGGIRPGFELQLNRSDDHLYLVLGDRQAEMALVRLNADH